MVQKVEDFNYLCGYVSSTEKDINSRLENNWAILNKMCDIWKSNIQKRSFFREIMESVLAYGSITLMLKRKNTKMKFHAKQRSALNQSYISIIPMRNIR